MSLGVISQKCKREKKGQTYNSGTKLAMRLPGVLMRGGRRVLKDRGCLVVVRMKVTPTNVRL